MPNSTKCTTLVGMASAEKGSTVRIGRMGMLFALVISMGGFCTGDDTWPGGIKSGETYGRGADKTLFK